MLIAKLNQTASKIHSKCGNIILVVYATEINIYFPLRQLYFRSDSYFCEYVMNTTHLKNLF